LQKNDAVSLESAIVLDRAEINYQSNYVSFRSTITGRTIAFKLLSSNYSISQTGISTTYSGFGIIQQRDTAVYNILKSHTGPVYPPFVEMVSCDCIVKNSNTPKRCEAGGHGATECAYSETVTGGPISAGASCSVKCADGY